MLRSLEPRAVTALVVTATSLFLMLCFTLYGPMEAAAGLTDPGMAVSLAAWFLDLLGAGAYVLVLVPFVWGMHVYFKEDTPALHMRAVGTLMLAASTAAVVGVLYAGEGDFWAGSLGNKNVT